MSGATDSSVATVVSNCMSAAGISGYTEAVSPTLASGPAAGTALTVTVSVPCADVSWANYGSWFQGQTLTGKAIMIKE